MKVLAPPVIVTFRNGTKFIDLLHISRANLHEYEFDELRRVWRDQRGNQIVCVMEK